MIPGLIIISIIGLMFLLHYLMFRTRNNPIPNRFEFETLRTYKKDPAYADYESNESDVQRNN